MKQLAVLPHWQEIPADDFAGDFPSTSMVGVNLDQRSAAHLRDCIIPWQGAPAGTLAWAAELGRSIYAKGRNVFWTVPFPGAKQMEAVNRGDYDDLYIGIAYQINASARAGGWKGDIWVRLFHEFNLWGNTENRALDAAGNGNADLYKKCFRRIAGLMRNACQYERRTLKIAFSPSVERSVVVDWEAAFPGKTCVDAITPDLYMCLAFGQTPGVYTGNWFREPLLRLRAFCEAKQLPFGLGEVGADDDSMAPDIEMALADVKACKSGWMMIQWWNDWQVVDCRITGGRLPGVAAAVRRVLE